MRQFVIITGLLVFLLTVGTVGIHFLTDRTWFESLFLAVITITTVGSRDVANDSPAAMAFIISYLLVGFSFFTYGAFQVGQMVINADLRRMWEKRKMEKQIDRLERHYIVCGLGRMGMAICEILAAKNQAFVVVDLDEERLRSICNDRQWKYIVGDATDDDILSHAGIDRAKSLATVLRSDADNVYVVLSARLLSSKLQIVARASDSSAATKLQKAGATRVISPISSGAVKMARLMISPSIEDFLEITDDSGGDLEIVEVQISENSPYLGKKLAETDLRTRGIMVIGIRRASGQHILAPSGMAVIEKDDSLFAFGNAQAVNDMTVALETGK